MRDWLTDMAAFTSIIIFIAGVAMTLPLIFPS